MLTAITVHLQLVGVGDNYSNAVIVAPDCCSTSTSAAAVSEVCAFVLIILLTISSQGQTQRLLTASQGHFTPMIGENWELVTDDPVEFEK